MSKKKNRTGNSGDIIKNIGKRLGGEKNKDEEKETNSSSDNKNNEEKNNTTNNDDEKSSKKVKENESINSGWLEEEEPYRSSFIVKPKMEINFEDCKRRFRRKFRMNLSKQNAIELGWLLLKNLDDEYFDEVKRTSSPDDDLVEELKEVIKKLY